MLGEEPGQRLHLIAPGIQREFLRICFADMVQTLAYRGEGLFPGNLLEFGTATAVAPAYARNGLVSRAGEYCFMIPEDPWRKSRPC